jgi:ABC-2 type transport system ATP-binding protein
MNALSFSSVQKSYGKESVLKGVSFFLQEGEFFALLGPNGAGKTTLINCLSGISKRESGEILVFGQDPEKNPIFTKSCLGVVEQEITFDPFFTPMETLRMRRGFFGMPKNDEYLHWLLEKLDLQKKENTLSVLLSGGMKRRLMIAQALAHEPKIIILDEPTAGVDVELRQNLWKFFQELRRERSITILLTTHYLEEAEALAERIAIIQEGKILVCESKKELLSRHKRILEIQLENGEKHFVALEANENIAQKIALFPDVLDISIREPRLEDIFLELTQKP